MRGGHLADARVGVRDVEQLNGVRCSIRTAQRAPPWGHRHRHRGRGRRADRPVETRVDDDDDTVDDPGVRWCKPRRAAATPPRHPRARPTRHRNPGRGLGRRRPRRNARRGQPQRGARLSALRPLPARDAGSGLGSCCVRQHLRNAQPHVDRGTVFEARCRRPAENGGDPAAPVSYLSAAITLVIVRVHRPREGQPAAPRPARAK